MATNTKSNRYTIWFCRNRAADMIGYAYANRFVNQKYDPELHTEASNIDATLFPSIEEAENAALDFAKKLFVYDHTKRPKVMTDFRIYRWWILDTTDPNFKPYCNKKHAVVKKGKADFTKCEDPSGGKLSKKIADDKISYKARLATRLEYFAKLCDIPTAFVDKPEPLRFVKVAPMDNISWYHQFDPTFYKDSLNLPDEFSIVFPAKGIFSTVRYSTIYNPDNTTIGHGFVLVHCKINFDRQFKTDRKKRSYYDNTLVGVFKTPESASIYSNLNGWTQPMVFKSLEENEENLLCNYIFNKYMNTSPATIYRLMVESGLREPIAKFSIKDGKTLKKTA